MTREEDLIRIAKKLDKMVSRNNTEGAMDLLKELRGFNMTLKLLQETRIGMSVNGIRKHCTDEEVIALAKVLIKDWKRLLDSGCSEKSTEMKNGLDSSTTAVSPNSSPSKTQSRKESLDSKPPSQKKHTGHVKKDRKDSSDSKVSNKTSDEVKRERKDSSDGKQPPPKRPSLDVKKEKHRKDSCDSKPGQPVKRPSSDSKVDRRDSTDAKKSCPLPAKKLTNERRDSHSSKTPQPGPPQRKPSTDSVERKGKLEAPKTPTTPTSPMSPGFSSPGGPLSPHLATGDTVRDKCIEMLTAALRTDSEANVTLQHLQ